MKRRLPNTRQGGSVLDLINIPPVTTDTNAHNPAVNTSCRPTAALCALAITATAAAIASLATRVSTSPPSSIVNAANPDHNTAARAANRRTQSRAVVCGTST